ncbi:MAG: hypothetical protein KIT79_00990 [Deltaproteobacteria bacterium]|nr:hypothetical protein [Deltaproteobacteria bacterium]
MKLVSAKTPLGKSESYGRFRNHPEGHLEQWEHWALEKGGLFAETDYDDWPRGRIVYDEESRIYLLYVDPQLQKFSDRVIRHFSLPVKRTKILYDEHYRSRKLLVAN